MIAKAPGKVVLSGAYSVLEGARAIVAAVDRVVVADSSREADFVTDEVAAAIKMGILARAPAFDASALRTQMPNGSSRKLGLGSSAAILAASIGAVRGGDFEGASQLREAIFPLAFEAHRRAQPGGSGIDVAASVFGGVIEARRLGDGALDVKKRGLPAGTVVEVFASPVSASTSSLLGRVREFAAARGDRYQGLMEEAKLGAEAAARAGSVDEFVKALGRQFEALGVLGEEAGAEIVTRADKALGVAAAALGAVFGPSGAGGGDVSVFVGREASSEGFRREAEGLGLLFLGVEVGAEGLRVER